MALDLQYFTATDALASLARGSCDMAGFHVPEGALGARAVDLYRRWLHPAEHQLIYLVRRQQGLYLKPGNPKQIASFPTSRARACVSSIDSVARVRA